MRSTELRDKLKYSGIQGINGLSMVEREKLPRTRQPIEQEVLEPKDVRDESIYRPRTYDYRITGEGRTPIVIREVHSDCEGMKRYALIGSEIKRDDHPKRKITKHNATGLEVGKDYETNLEHAEVIYVYSEGIDFNKMSEDAEYAREIISLFGEERIRQKQAQSENLGMPDVVYLGTVAQTESGYTKAGIKDYRAAITKIGLEVQGKQKERRKKMAEERRKGQKAQDETQAREFVAGSDKRRLEMIMGVCLEELEKQVPPEKFLDELAGFLKGYMKAKEQQDNGEKATTEGEEPDQ